MLENPGDDAVRAEPEGRVADLLRVLEVARRLAVVSELPGLLEVVEESAARVLDCDHVDVFLPDARGDALCGRRGEVRGPPTVGPSARRSAAGWSSPTPGRRATSRAASPGAGCWPGP